MRQLPWHADTLLQLGELYSHREGQTLHSPLDLISIFIRTQPSGRLHRTCPLYIRTCFRRSVHIHKWAFEFAKLLLSLDPWSDPHGAYLHLDFLAIKCAMYSWFSSFYAIFSPASSETPDHSSDLEEPRSDYPPVCALPGWAYARALAFRAGGDDQASQVRPSVSVDKRPSEAD